MLDVLETFAHVLAQLSPFLLLGFGIASLLHAYVPRSWLTRLVGGSGLGPILRAAAVGLPLPLCSCGVIPVAVELRKRGASRGATTSFLISTPETGVDSVAASAAVLHPLMVVFRPLAALFTAVVTGLAVERFSKPPETTEEDAGGHCCHSSPESELDGQRLGFWGGLRYGFVDLFGEVSVYLLPAVLITALLTVLIEPATVESVVPSRALQMVVLLVLSVPIYVCAAAATPVAAGLILAGFSPGAALVFLLAGPATNLVTISTAAKTVGRGGAMVYLVCVASISVAFGVLLDAIFDYARIEASAAASPVHEHLGWLQWTSAGIIGALVIWHLFRKLRGTR